MSATERDLLDLLWQRYETRNGNGPRWAMAEHVRDRAGWDATRTLDAIVMDTWQSSGLALHGFEIKCSRGDWLRELAQPWKAAAFTRWCDYFWIVASPGVVKREELPERWGLMEPRRNALRAVVRAGRLDPEPLDRSFIAALLRAACHRHPVRRAAAGMSEETHEQALTAERALADDEAEKAQDAG